MTRPVLTSTGGLIGQVELVGPHGAAQFAFHAQPGLRLLVHPLGEETEAVAPRQLGLVHGDIGVAQQGLLGASIIGIDRQPDAGGGDEIAAADGEGMGETLDDAARRVPRRLNIVEITHDHQELVAAESGDNPSRPDCLAQALGGKDQQFIPVLMAERIVDGLEFIEIDEEQGDLPRRLAGLFDLAA
jgi:hypothetical protein